jgi:uncharacterized membrane protein YfcA
MAPVLLVALVFFRNINKLQWRMALLAAVLALQLVAAYGSLRWGNRWLPLLAPVTALVLVGVLYGVDAYLVEGKERRRLRRIGEVQQNAQTPAPAAATAPGRAAAAAS